ncbi:cadherin-like and PC-esterase domain-containing protein 1 isoform X2 [Takifugu rubripes]|uniref:cadherin-like and PC-esterase domain-containing protein 1 isoform X2 n=1 Tax=Takifugu rubripes TaxID=31033 RepID=UPI0011454FF4|nr:cadherin-like and PC-esterase domain-containing protein 1 isoform X2 [Takifugu rubripes]
MRVLLLSAGMLLRRRSCLSGPLLLLGLGLCLYQTLMLAWNRVRSGQRGRSREPVQRVAVDEETRRILSVLEAAQVQSQSLPVQRWAVVLLGQHLVSDTEVQLYQRVLQQMEFEVLLSRSTDTSSFLGSNHGVSGWSLLICLSRSERSCLRRISLSYLHRHQIVNLLPGLMAAFSDAGGGLCHMFTGSPLSGSQLNMRPFSCGLTNRTLLFGVNSQSAVGALPPALVVSVYVLVTSVNPLTSFLHETSVTMTHLEQNGRVTQLRDFLQRQLGQIKAHQALGEVKAVISHALQAAVSSNQKQGARRRCVWCYQLMTFTLLFSGSITPEIVQVNTDLIFSGLTEDKFDRQITRDLILEDTLHFLLHSQTHLSQQYGGCRGTHGLCLSEDDLLLLLRFQQQMKIPSNFQLLCPSSSSSSSSSGPVGVSDLQMKLGRYYGLQRKLDSRGDLSLQGAALSSSKDEGSCLDPHLRQIYIDPPLTLAPPFTPRVKVYHSEVSFETVTVRLRAEAMSPKCQVHVEDQQGPRMVTYPVGLGDNTIRILVTDDDGPETVVMATYTVYMYRENRPSLPMFGDHIMCSFVQDCGLLVQPAQPCGLQPFRPQSPGQTCSSGHVPGQWVVPCLSCSDNRTCDWRDVAWQPRGCFHPVVERQLLQDCLADRKLLFLGDSTNRGMMFFLMERVNSSLEDWGKAHDTLVYRNLNAQRTSVSYSYYPQFWLEKPRRPSFRQALLQLISRSRPLLNSYQTVLVVGGVQWLNTNHLRTVKEVLHSEALAEILVVVKALGMGFHLPVDGIRSLGLAEIQELNAENLRIIQAAEQEGYEVIDTFSITMGRYKEFLQGRCACHFHEVKFTSFQRSNRTTSINTRTRTKRTGTGLISQSSKSDTEQEAWPKSSSYHVRGAVNQVYSEILLSRLCPKI